MDAFVEAAAPSAPGKGKERRFVVGACVQVEARPWAAGGKGVVTTAHPDGTYNVNISTAEAESSGGPAHPDVVSWVYLQPCDGSRSEDQARADGRLLVDMAAVSTALLPSRLCACLVNEQLTGHRCNQESCGLPQNGSHSGWACGYLTPPAVLRGLRAQIAAGAAPGLTPAQAARVARSSMSTLYVVLVKWEELQAYAVAHPEHGPWPSSLPSKDAAFAKLVAQLQKTGVTTVSGSAKFSETWLRDRVYHGNATGC